MIRLKSLHHVAFAVTELQKTERFARDFGLRTVSNDGETLYMRTSGGDAYAYTAMQSRERGTLGIAFLVEAVSDLEEAVNKHGATPVREHEGPGGGKAVTLTGPEGLRIELLADVQGVPAEAGPDPLRLNTPVETIRWQEIQSKRPLGPAHLFRLGHTGVYVKDCASAMAWFRDVLGLSVSDTMHPPGAPDHLITAFMRIDRGEEWVDHHSLFLVEFGKTDIHHISFEVMDYEAQFVTHRWLLDQGWEPNWGVGRHPLGSHVFDVWFDPDRYRFETFSDTDKVNRDREPGHYNVQDCEMDIWCSRSPEPYFE